MGTMGNYLYHLWPLEASPPHGRSLRIPSRRFPRCHLASIGRSSTIGHPCGPPLTL